jgi:hypothetical protein
MIQSRPSVCATSLIVAAFLVTDAMVLAQQASRPRQTTVAQPIPNVGDVEKELIRMQQLWADAVVNQDGGVMDRILADDFVVTGPTGHVSSRAELIEMVVGGVSQVDSLEVDNMFVHVYANAAVIFGRSTYKTRPGRADLAGSYRWTNTYIRRGGRWQCVSAHEGGRTAPASERNADPPIVNPARSNLLGGDAY